MFTEAACPQLLGKSLIEAAALCLAGSGATPLHDFHVPVMYLARIHTRALLPFHWLVKGYTILLLFSRGAAGADFCYSSPANERAQSHCA